MRKKGEITMSFSSTKTSFSRFVKKLRKPFTRCVRPKVEGDYGNEESTYSGVALKNLTSEHNPVPLIMQMILEYIEEHGLHTEGIYRKCGNALRMKHLQKCFDQDHPEEKQLTAVYKAIEKLPAANSKILEYLILHLMKVALLEDSNKMSPNALAVIFAPCILCATSRDPHTCRSDILKATICVAMLINDKMKKYLNNMEDAEYLETARESGAVTCD